MSSASPISRVTGLFILDRMFNRRYLRRSLVILPAPADHCLESYTEALNAICLGRQLDI
jgi:hypothetical protein